MTAEEAIDLLDNLIGMITDNHDSDYDTALRMGINAIKNGDKQEPKIGHCKNCKHFEYDSLTKVDGIKLIFAHEICKRWGNGCKTREDGYCFMFESQER